MHMHMHMHMHMPAPDLILASASPRRRALLAQLGLAFEVRPATHVEAERGAETGRDEAPTEYAVRLAGAKTRAVARTLRARERPAVVLGADTIVVVDRSILGKPADTADARRMLLLLSGRTHEVITGYALIRVDSQHEQNHTEAVSTKVRFRSLREDMVQWYIATGEPFDKAGAYGIQGRAAAFVTAIEGCYYNVVGLPLARVCDALERFGVAVYRTPPEDAAVQME